MRKIKNHLMTCMIAVLMCCMAFPATAFAGGGPETEEPEIVTPVPEEAPEPTIEPGEPLSEGSEFNTRDLLYDKATNKQFITVQGRDGNTFYIVIDYDAPVNEDEEQYTTYFLNQVDEADLKALLKEDTPDACDCTEKCSPGNVKMDCPVCAADMTACAGKEPEPEPPVKPEPLEPEPEPKAKSSAGGMLVILLVLALAGGGAFYYLKVVKNKPKTKGNDNLDDYDYGDDLDEDEIMEDEASETEPEDEDREPEGDAEDEDE